MSNLEKIYRNHLIWARYRRMMKRLAVGTALFIIIVFAVLWKLGGPLPLHFVIAITLGVFAMVMLTVALMGLVFVSANTEHDDAVVDPTGERDEA